MTTMNGGRDDGNDNKQQPQIDDAKNFLERVKETFKDHKGVYDRFVEIMKNFKHDRLNTGGVIKEVQELFQGHEELFVGFQNFLPAAGLVTPAELREIQQNMNSSTRNGHNSSNGNNGANPDFNMAVTFICKIKQRFGSHRRIYQEFLQILQHFQTAAQANDTSVIKNVKNRIRALFRDHPDLLDQFDYFLPPLTAHFARNNQSSSTATAADTENSNSNNTDTLRINGRKRRRDSDLDNQPDTKRRRQDETDNKRKSRKDIDETWHPKTERMQTRSRTNNKRKHRSHKNKNRSHREHPRDANHSLHNNNTNNDKDSDIDDDEITFSDNDISDTEAGIMGSKRDTMGIMGGAGGGDGMDGTGDEHKGLRIFSKLRKDIPDHLYKHVLTLTQLYPMGLTEFSVVGKLICDALREHGHTELMKEFQKELSSSKQSWFFRSRGQNYYEYLTNNILLKSCVAVQSSYRQLPSDVVQPRCSGRHPDAAAVLNDYFVSKPTGGEGNQPNGDGINTAGGRLKNIYNENLQKSEDDLFELDMMIATNDAARKRLEQLYKTVMQPQTQTHSGIAKTIEIPPVEKRAISRLYSEHGNKVLNLLKKMPETTIPVVLKRLREKSNEWQQLKSEMKIVWKSVSTKNYFKAQDFRYTIFKQYDSKRITLKNICKQIEERHLKNQRQTQRQILHEEKEDIDIDMDNHNNNVIVPEYNFDYDNIHQCDNKQRMEGRNNGLDFDDCNIADNNGGVIINGNGVVSGVGLIGNASHDHIISKMGAGLYVELGDYKSDNLDSVINNYDYRFVICKQDILRDCARFIFQHANTSEVGKEKKEKKLFAEILESIFKEFFEMNISEQSIEFLQNDIDSDDEEEEDTISDTLKQNSNANHSSLSTSSNDDPISKVMRGIDTQNESVLSAINYEKSNQSIHRYVTQYFEEKSDNSTLVFGNKTIYALFRYLHFLYTRMNFAYKLCRGENELYRKIETTEDLQRKYKDFLSHLSKLINGQIEEEVFEDECRKLLGLKAYQLFTISKVIRYVYDRICDFDTDDRLHEYYKLFLSMKKKIKSKQNRIKYFISATQISNKGKGDDLYQIEYFNNKILCMSLSDKYEQNNNGSLPPPLQPTTPQPIIAQSIAQTQAFNTNNSNSNNIHLDIKMAENNIKK